MDRQRAVSDVVSFTLVFSLVAVTVSVVYVGGLGAVEDSRDAERFDNAERAFDVLADNIADIHQDGAPSRATEVKLADSNIGYDNQTRVNVTIDNLPGAAANRSQEVSLDPIRYTTNGRDSALTYEAGAVIRTEQGGAIVVSDSPFLFVEDGATRTALLPIVETRAGPTRSVGGQSTILVRANLAVQESLFSRAAAMDPNVTSSYEVSLTLETEPERAEVWRDHLEERIPASFSAGTACSVVDGDTVECDIEVEELYVSVSRIETDFE